MPYDVKAAFLKMRSVLAEALRDPLRAFRENGPKQNEPIKFLSQRLEVYLRAANKFGKTTLGARYFVAVARGKRSFLGIPIPRVPVPNIGIVLSLDYKQQQLSVQRAYLSAIGDWPHHVSWVPGHHGRIVQSIAVRPDDWPSDDHATWSHINFHSQQNRRTGTGARAHWAHADEPPIESVWREVRKAGEPGWPFIRLITATPTFRSTWWWLKQDFPKVPGRPEGGRVVVEASIYDAMRTPENPLGSISEEEVRELEQIYEGDVLKEARLFGYECDTVGASPFKRHLAILQKWLQDSVPPMLEEWEVLRQVMTPDGVAHVLELLDVEVWADYDEKESYYVVGDPSKGIDDPEHDPGELQVWAMRRPRLVARYNGYIGSYGLGVLAAGLGQRYGNALVDVDVTGGYGDAFLTALHDCKYPFVAHETVPVKHNEARTTLGFTISAHTRAQFVSAIQEALVAAEAGHGYMLIESEDVLRCLLDLTMDKHGRPITAPGFHDESFVLVGRAGWRCMRVGAPREPRRRQPETPREAGRRRMREQMGLPPERRVSNRKRQAIRMRKQPRA